MHNKQELDAIALEWAHQNIESWQHEYGSWDNLIEEYGLDDDEWDYCRSKNFKIEIIN